MVAKLVEDEALVLPMDEETGAIVPWLDDPCYEVGAFLLGFEDDPTEEFGDAALRARPSALSG